MNIKKILSPNYILIFFIIFIVIFISVNYIGYEFFQSNEYFYKKIKTTFNLFCFIPGTAVFLGISIFNFSISKSCNNKRNIKISLIPICLITIYYLYIFIRLVYGFLTSEYI
ncbi:magnesium-transporting ATPase (P-type) [Chryseobacterium sp. 2987]|nr:magnesium-transporting ATPase (P-type) [Chryseobacterium sp. 2987]